MNKSSKQKKTDTGMKLLFIHIAKSDDNSLAGVPIKELIEIGYNYYSMKYFML